MRQSINKNNWLPGNFTSPTIDVKTYSANCKNSQQNHSFYGAAAGKFPLISHRERLYLANE
ncbi:hypothetical protein A3A71_03475 [Candidatus Berkelbacteria bacterium RIFCSPLOWO2_01_FULL_50_28]|uniref:Uncharacterized protein n=1 Tax=Candidatus Berkelbacteria bacterium RIFCSPLOWO2_01_FULL_50_28 TaxID=1797471 RepID=A0A1F5ECM1_9BACT|nr:MAG: hypothetical protein A2807_03040 [Candidatus Berkelbacteria bacterium RIFCSPHIGHO2_01_FULL_50_36]OGD63639.1 MAG: hypothetical protein A3F39_04250 [Candidatus Berkelbacteria bacterium RIFCSPHIGHO2_12_FULL_50_11]OGD65115.1 MAG: hypothetical protein A3A71_03475 [Candidatus Berkelbacteria bacterium RIFCSPLOWO2_01_FULL_50_28]